MFPDHLLLLTLIKERVKPSLSGWRSDSALRDDTYVPLSLSALGHISKAFENEPSGRLGAFFTLPDLEG